MEKLPQQLPERLLEWYAAGHRDLPWRRDREPYHVWLSEVMLQQTRVEAVKGYYRRFLAELPDIPALAACPPDRLAKLWEGLGYYSRMRNLQNAAQVIVSAHGGVFPREYDAIRALPGVGDYTAGAIASICFGLPEPAVDGNVLRVLSRVTDDAAPVTDAAVKREYAARLREIYPAGRCGDFTQSLMELGATVCGPNSQPQCALCPLASLCLARANGTALLRPVKAPKKEKRTEEKTVFILRCGTRIAVRRRPEQGLLAGLWELPNVDGKCSAQQALAQAERWGVHPRELCRSSEKTHIFTHIRWELRGFYIECAEAAPLFTWIDPARFRQDIALPTAFRIFEAFEEV